MKTKHFVQALDHARITAAIAEAERATSGQIRVFVSHRDVDDALAAARERFAKLGMEKTAARNAVLIFLAPEARKYAVVGDEGIHGRCGADEFWKSRRRRDDAPAAQGRPVHGRHRRGGRRGGPGAGRAFSTATRPGSQR